MKNRLLLAALLPAAVIVASACGDEGPVSPGLTSQPQLHKEGGEDDDDEEGTSTSGTSVLDLSDPSQPSNAPECIRVDAEGTVRFRRCEFSGPITGDLVGNEPISVVDLRVDAFGNGRAKGSFIFNVCHADLGCGLFEGRFKGPITAGAAEFKVKARGTSGDFVGLKLRGTSRSPGNRVFTLDFTIR